MSGQRWTEAEIARLRALVGTMPVAEIAAQVGRTTAATRQEMNRLRILQREARRRGIARAPSPPAPTCGPGGCIAVKGRANHGKMHFCLRPALAGLPYCAGCMPVLRGAATQAGKRP